MPEGRRGRSRPLPLPGPVRLAVEAVEDRKGLDLEVLDLRGVTDATDYFLIASGTSDAHVRGLMDSVLETLARHGVHAHHVEGVPAGRWVLIDFVDFVVHLFHPEARAFYQLERLWSDAPVVVSQPLRQEKGRLR
jgi:ribosome-associated protein